MEIVDPGSEWHVANDPKPTLHPYKFDSVNYWWSHSLLEVRRAMPNATIEPIMKIVMGFMAAKYLFAASKIGLFEACASGLPPGACKKYRIKHHSCIQHAALNIIFQVQS